MRVGELSTTSWVIKVDRQATLRSVQRRLTILRDGHRIELEWEPLDKTRLYVTATGDDNERALVISYLQRIPGI